MEREGETAQGTEGVMYPLSISMADSHGECMDGGRKLKQCWTN